ncbi:phosphoribosyltransferase [Marinobacterium arenosum]|uniref:phosphoribosyltransferase n=1 Tax=Marinobacterium arenosum TaxID=2862496 RepID=UPI0021051D80|nr:phosphoribosyltransferase family protein [Marinobacterium arenosum]
MKLPYLDRTSAGQALAAALGDYQGRDDLMVLALPRGGVPVALEVCRVLKAPLDLMIVRKLGVPGHEELAMGAIASGGFRVINQDVVNYQRIGDEVIERVAEKEQAELQRRLRKYRGDKPWPSLADKCVILVDDGIATGATMQVAIKAVCAESPSAVVVAVPVAPASTLHLLRQRVIDVVCPEVPQTFYAIGQFYVDFHQVSDEEMAGLMQQASRLE